MKTLFNHIPLQWRVFLATSLTITLLFVVAGWGLQNYALSVAGQSVRSEIRASIQVYEALWKARTQVLSASTALMSAMSDVRAAVMTRDERTIRDSAGELWSRVSNQSAAFAVLDPEGQVIASLSGGNGDFTLPQVPLKDVRSRFPRQLAGYVRQGSKLFYIVLTPVYVQTSQQPMLLNVLCAGFAIDNQVAGELKRLAPGSDIAFLDDKQVFASTLGQRFGHPSPRELRPASGSDRQRLHGEDFISLGQRLNDISGRPIAELRILHSYDAVEASLGNLRRILALAWLATVVIALLLSLVMTQRILDPIRLLDRGATEIAARNYNYRVPVAGNDELSRLAATFNEMCDSIEHARADLIRQEQMDTIGRLGSSLVHDLRNPLAAIYGGAEMLMDAHLPPEHIKRIAGNIYRASHRVQELLRDLLNVSRGETGTLECCHLREVVDAAAESIEPVPTGMNIKISIDTSIEVVVDRTRAERVFTNLLSNAADAIPEGGEVFVYCREERDKLLVFIEDTGPGLPEAVRAQLFRPFVTGKRSGLGLGLTLSRQTMLELGGDLQLVSEPGAGARFCLTFPKPSRVGSQDSESERRRTMSSTAV
jgi:signal transduction histidine kinase